MTFAIVLKTSNKRNVQMSDDIVRGPAISIIVSNGNYVVGISRSFEKRARARWRLHHETNSYITFTNFSYIRLKTKDTPTRAATAVPFFQDPPETSIKAPPAAAEEEEVATAEEAFEETFDTNEEAAEAVAAEAPDVMPL